MKFNLPNKEEFLNQLPTAESFMNRATGKMEEFNAKLIKPEDFTKKISTGDYEGILNSMNSIKTTGELASFAGSKVGIKINSEKVDNVLTQIDELKQKAGEKALDTLRPIGKQIGVHIPSISQEDILNQLITDDMDANFESKLTAIEGKIKSVGEKADNLTSNDILKIISADDTEIDLDSKINSINSFIDSKIKGE